MIDQESGAAERMGLGEYLLVLRRRWRLVSALLVVTVLLALGYSFAVTPQYVATADVLIEPSGADIEASGGSEIALEEVATQAQVVTSLPVARLVQDRLSLTATPDLAELVSVQSVGTSRILRITARDTIARRAASTANTVATAYLQFRRDDSIGRYEQASVRLSEQQSDTERRLKEVDSLLASDDAGTLSLEGERRTLLAKLAQITTQLDSLSDSLATAAAGGELLREASPPAAPVSPRPILNGVLGGLFGLLLGAGAALLRDRFDDVVHDEEMVRRALGGAVVLGRVPRWSEQAYRGRLISLVEPHSPASEEYQRLGINVRFLLATVRKSRDSGAVVLATSGQEAEGKTVTACNLAVVAAGLGLRVVMVDADLRRASAAPRFGLGDPPGLSDLLASDDPTDSYLIDVGVEGLRILPAGTIPPNSAALLSSARMRMVLADLTAQADLVVIDSPPVMAVADTLELAGLADQVIVVAREGVSRRRTLATVLESLRHIGVQAVGTVYNGSGDGTRKSYTYTPRERSSDAPPAGLGAGDDADEDFDAAGGDRGDVGVQEEAALQARRHAAASRVGLR